MKVMTLKVSGKTLFGIILVAVGLIVIGITFFSNHITGSTEKVSKTISCQTDNERLEYLTNLGWECGECTSKEVTIPKNWNDVYNDYNAIQQDYGYDLTPYKGKVVTIYSYEILNYENHPEGTIANLIVSGGNLIGGDICNTSATEGFIYGLEKKK